MLCFGGATSAEKGKRAARRTWPGMPWIYGVIGVCAVLVVGGLVLRLRGYRLPQTGQIILAGLASAFVAAAFVLHYIAFGFDIALEAETSVFALAVIIGVVVCSVQPQWRGPRFLLQWWLSALVFALGSSTAVSLLHPLTRR